MVLTGASEGARTRRAVRVQPGRPSPSWLEIRGKRGESTAPNVTTDSDIPSNRGTRVALAVGYILGPQGVTTTLLCTQSTYIGFFISPQVDRMGQACLMHAE